jgi:hypothetical protein
VKQLGTHEQSVTDEWYTPPYIFDALEEIFDVDVAHPGAHVVDWVPAKQLITHDSLKVDWHGFIWMNAPFGPRNAGARHQPDGDRRSRRRRPDARGATGAGVRAAAATLGGTR